MMKIYIQIELITLFISTTLSKFLNDAKTYSSIINEQGYNFEEYTVETSDDYLLTIWRLPSKIGLPTNKKPIVLQHGLLDDSWTWFSLDELSLPYELVSKGYDVWVSNVRGNLFSYKHKTLQDARNPWSPYWNFSFEDMSSKDLPAVVNFIKEKTGVDKIDYIGHSQGTTIFFLNFLSDPSFLQNNIAHFVGLGPVPSVAHASSEIVKVLADSDFFKNKFPFKNAFRLGTTMGKVISFLCTHMAPVCKLVVDALAAENDTKRIDYNEKGDLWLYEPGGTSHMNILHWLQCYKAGRMQHFDYGEEENLKRYGTETPPPYDVNNLKEWNIPTLLTISGIDPFSSLEDIYEFISGVGNPDVIQTIGLENYNHVDVTWSKDSVEDINPIILDFLKN